MKKKSSNKNRTYKKKTNKNRSYKKKTNKKKKKKKNKRQSYKKKTNKMIYYANDVEKAAYLLSKKNRDQIKSGATAQEWKDWFKEKIPSKPEFIDKIGNALNIFNKLPNIMQNQMTIYLYSIDNVDPILLSEDDDNYDSRNDHNRIKNIMNQLKKSSQFTKHLQKRDYGYNDNISSEELWQVLQEEVIAKIINDFMKRSLDNSK